MGNNSQHASMFLLNGGMQLMDCFSLPVWDPSVYPGIPSVFLYVAACIVNNAWYTGGTPRGLAVLHCTCNVKQTMVICVLVCTYVCSNTCVYVCPCMEDCAVEDLYLSKETCCFNSHPPSYLQWGDEG